MNHVGDLLGKCIIDLNKSSQVEAAPASELSGVESSLEEGRKPFSFHNFRTVIASNPQDYIRALLRK